MSAEAARTQARPSSGAGDFCNQKVVRQFAMTLVWGMAVGVVLAAQLMFPHLT